MEGFEDPTGRVKKEELQTLATFVDDQVKAQGLDAVTVMIVAQILYFKAKKLSTDPVLTWVERRSIITAMIDWVAKRYLDDIDYQALQPSITIIVPDTLDSMREFGKSKVRGLCGCFTGSGKIKEDLEETAIAKLEQA